ncbi:IclR family transcriptional regulator [Cellulosimicrobium funkei]|nr:IclR family transcriptional regulator [Cellulosimicrobium funkei]
MTEPNDPMPPLGTANRLLAVLLTFEQDGAALSLSEVARRTALPTSTARRLLGQLCAARMLERVDDGRYQVGARLFELGMRAPVPRLLREVAVPVMEDLHSATRENVHLGILDVDSVLVIQQHTGNRSVPTPARSGARLPAHSTANGKALLAFSRPELVNQVLAGGIPRITEYTVSSTTTLRDQLDEARDRGWAVSQQENSLGTLSVGAPIFGHDGYAVAALSNVIPATTREFQPYAHAVKTASMTITRLWAQAQPRR